MKFVSHSYQKNIVHSPYKGLCIYLTNIQGSSMKTVEAKALYEERYTIAETSRFVGLSSSRVRRWLKGYRYRWTAAGEEKAHKQEPIIKHKEKGGTDAFGVSFLDLVELLSVKSFVEKGFSLQRIRGAVSEAESILALDYPFARRSFFVDSNQIYLQVKDKNAERLLQLFSNGQLVIDDIVRHKALQITFDATSGLPIDWWPLGKNQNVVLCPSIAYGAPAVASRNIKTLNVYDMFLAEKGAIEPVSSWFDLSSQEVHSAVEFEKYLRAA